jgi:hypothetical protein
MPFSYSLNGIFYGAMVLLLRGFTGLTDAGDV